MSKPDEITVTPEMVEALRDVVRHKLAMWDASLVLEQLIGMDVDTSGAEIDTIAAGVHDVSDISEDDVLYVINGE